MKLSRFRYAKRMRCPLVFILSLCWFFSSSLEASQRPNIVIILADDLGYGDIRRFQPGSPIDTPHLGALAAQGVRFTDAHAGGSVCVPSRYALMTGRFSTRAKNLQDREGPVVEEETETIAGLLRRQGYRTEMVGKWHLGFETLPRPDGERLVRFDYSKPFRSGPVDRGFDRFFGMHASLDIPPYFFLEDRTPVALPTETIEAHDSMSTAENWNEIQGAFWREGPIAPGFEMETVTPRFCETAIQRITTHEDKFPDQPLFLYLALPSPHTPWLPTKEFQGKSKVGLYGDFILQVDDVVGRVVEAIKQAGMTEDTLLFFSSDNGPVWYEKDIEHFGHDAMGGLRGKKGSPYEGGHRVPLLASWPGQIPPGSQSDQLIAFSDFYATFAELTEDPEPQGDKNSWSFLKQLRIPEQTSKRPPIVHNFNSVREGEWKLVIPPKRRQNAREQRLERAELYHLATDRKESIDVAESQSEMVTRLYDILEENTYDSAGN